MNPDELNEGQAARIKSMATRMLEMGKSREEVTAFVQRAVDRMATSAAEMADAQRLTGLQRAAGVAQAVNQGTTFNFGDEIAGFGGAVVDKVRNPGQPFGALLDRNIRDQRDNLQAFRDENPKTALGLELGGGALAGLGAAGVAAAGRTGLSAIGRVAASGAGGGALGGIGSGEGASSRLTRGAVGAGLGAGLGYGVGKIATSRVGDAIARGTRNVVNAVRPTAASNAMTVPAAQTLANMDGTTQAAVRSIADRTGGTDALASARSLLDEFDNAGLTDEVIAADVLPSGARELRRAFNVSSQAAAPGRTQLLERGARVGQRSRDALTRATGLSPQTTRAGVDDLVAERAANAKPLYDAAMDEGRTNMAPPILRSFLDEPPIQKLTNSLRELSEFQGVADDSPEMLDAIYKVLSDRHATIKAAQVFDPDNLGRFQKTDLESMKGRFLDAVSSPSAVDVPVPPPMVAQAPAPSVRDAIEAHRTRLGQSVTRNQGTVMQQRAREALERRVAERSIPASVTGQPAPRSVRQDVPAFMPSYRPAVTQFADDSRLKDAYEKGLAMFNKPVGDIRAEMAKLTAPDELDLFKRGAFDALLERRVGPASPNADLGEFARQSKMAGQATVNTEPAADRLRTIFGDDAYRQVLGAARGEGRFTQTASDAIQNSTTAQQLGDMGVFGQMAQDAMTGGADTPGWWMRQGGNVADATRRMFDEPASRRAAELLLDRPQMLLQLLEQLGQSDAARRAAIQPIAGQAVRAGQSRMP